MTNTLNFGAYYAVWILTILAASAGHPWIATAIPACGVLWHLERCGFHAGETRLTWAALAVGLLVDNALTAAGLCAFDATTGPLPVPLWMTGLWPAFAATLRHALRWLLGRPALAALLGGLGGPLAYLGGQSFGAITLPHEALSLLGVGVAYAAAVPLLARIAARDLPALEDAPSDAVESRA